MSIKSHKKVLSDNIKNINEEAVKQQGYRKPKKPPYESPLKNYVYVNDGIKKVVAYLRVSTKSEGQSKSIDDNQPAIIEKMLKSKEYRDTHMFLATYPEWYSGTKVLRPVLEVLLQDAGLNIIAENFDYYPIVGDSNKKAQGVTIKMEIIKPSKFDEIWFKSTSRMARNIDIMPIIQMLMYNKVVIRFLDIGMNTIDNTTSEIAEKILADMKYSENLSRNIKASKELAIERGENPLRNTFGYTLIPTTKTEANRLIENKEEADIVRFIYNTYLNGFNGEEYGCSKLSKLLSMDIPELNKQPMFTRKGKPFAKSTINRILRSETYIGYKRHGKYSQKDVSSLFKVKASMSINHKIKMVRDERVEPILDEDLWLKVQYKLDKELKFEDDCENAEETSNYDTLNFTKPELYTKKPITTGRKYPVNKSKRKYSPYLVCGYCNSNFRYDNNYGNSFYTCALKDDKGYDFCQVNNVYTTQLDEFILRYADTDFNELFKIDFVNKLNSLLNYVEKLLFERESILNSSKIDEIKKNKKIDEFKLSLILDGINETSFNNSKIKEDINNIKNSILYYEEQLQRLSLSTQEKDDIIGKLFSAMNDIINHFEKLPDSYTTSDILKKIDRIVVQGKRPKNTNKKGNPILIPYFKLTTNNVVQEFIDKFDVEIPTYTYRILSGIEWFDVIDYYISNAKLNEELSCYLKGFKTLEEAQEHSKADNTISDDLKTYLAYFDTLEEALAENKLSPYDKDLRQKDLMIPYKNDIPTATFDFDKDALNRKFGSKVLTFNEKGEQIETVGYSFNSGLNETNPVYDVKNRFVTLKSAFNNLKRQYNKEDRM